MAFPSFNPLDDPDIPVEEEFYPQPLTPRRRRRRPSLLLLRPSIVPPGVVSPNIASPSIVAPRAVLRSVLDESYQSLSLEPPQSPRLEALPVPAWPVVDETCILPPPSLEVSNNTTVLTNNDIRMFSHLLPYLRDDDKDNDDDRGDSAARRDEDIRIELTCEICMDAKLEMPHYLSTPSQDSTNSSKKRVWNAEPFAVTPCGHIFGYTCLSAAVWMDISRGKEPVCPVCRDRLVYTCGHLIKLRPYNVRVPRARQLPVTVLEGGAVPGHCIDCEQQNFEEHLSVMKSTIYPFERRCAYIDPSGDGPDQVDVLRTQLTRDLEKQFRENRDRMLRW